jgi:hypothetical protein
VARGRDARNRRGCFTTHPLCEIRDWSGCAALERGRFFLRSSEATHRCRQTARRFLVDDVRDANAAAGHSARATTATASRTRHAEHATMSDPWADPVGPSGGWGTGGAAPVRARDARSRDAPSSPRRGFVARFPPARRDVFAAPRPLAASTPRGGPRARSLLTFAHPPLDPLRPPLPGVRASRRLCRPSRWTARTSPSPRSGGGRDAPRTNA